jgi:hypothetical protein
VRAFLAELYSVIGTGSVGCVRLTEVLDAWLDENRAVDAKPLNRLATNLAKTCGGFDEPLDGVVVIIAVDNDTGQSVGLTDNQLPGDHTSGEEPRRAQALSSARRGP